MEIKLNRDYINNPLKKGEYPELDDIKFLFLELNLSREECAKICNCNPEKVKIVCQKNKLQKTKEQRAELRRKTNLQKYGVINVSQLKQVKEKKKQTTLENYGVENPAQSKEVYNRIKETCMDRYGVESTNMLINKKDKIKNTIRDRYGVDNIMQLVNKQDLSQQQKQIKTKIQNNFIAMVDKIQETKRTKNTFHTSSTEEQAYTLLNKLFITERQYKSTEYPFACDFYLPELDLYIECNFSWTHGGFPFINDNVCVEQLKRWKYKAQTSHFYKNAIETWTIRDPLKRNTAKQNKLNWIEFFTLKEFKEWYNDICEILK